MADAFRVHWHDAGREARSAPDPDHPHGVAVDASAGAALACSTALPYPALRCGHFSVTCLLCGSSVAVTTAGRPDDPHTVKLACRMPGRA